MHIKINFKGKDFHEIERQVLLAYNDVAKYFVKKPNNIDIQIHVDRKTFEKSLGRKTREWEVANASYTGKIDIIHPTAFQNESTHDQEDFIPVLKHEFAHLFLDALSNGHKLPRWLDEGYSSYVAGLRISDDKIQIEENFCKKLGTLKGWARHSNHDAYKTAQLFVKYLVERFSKAKINKLILALGKDYHYNNLSVNFEKIFKKNIEIVEKDFIETINLAS